jgi:hypothetical protein
MKKGLEEPQGGLPRNYLRPCLLLLLAEESGLGGGELLSMPAASRLVDSANAVRPRTLL